MVKHPLPAPETLRQLLRYEPETGKLFWLERGVEWFRDGFRDARGNMANWNSRWAGEQAFTAMHNAGYHQGQIQNRPYLAHRVIWTIVHGCWPEHEIDHINMDRSDNRIANLRAATRSENNRNRTAASSNPTRLKGVTWDRHAGKWMAQIGLNGKNYNLGHHRSAEDAHAAYCVAADRMHGAFARVG